MKLVTGIEAIQSGKPFRKVVELPGNRICFGEWFIPNDIYTFTVGSLREKTYEIKPEPREFWLEINENGTPIVVDTEEFNPCHGKTKVIKVREVLDED